MATRWLGTEGPRIKKAGQQMEVYQYEHELAVPRNDLIGSTWSDLK